MTSKKKKLEKVTQPGAKFTRFRNMSIGSQISIFVIAIVVLLSIFAPLLAPYSPSQTFASWVAPSSEHIFGTDHVGRDIL
ncbi:MAG TPA: ABC transporter, partial [Actinomyces sp.]|nr:ABC transporter [Actinomyces sp.]